MQSVICEEVGLNKASPAELRASLEMAHSLAQLVSGLYQFQLKQMKNFTG